jgi:tight adherence protein C
MLALGWGVALMVAMLLARLTDPRRRLKRRLQELKAESHPSISSEQNQNRGSTSRPAWLAWTVTLSPAELRERRAALRARLRKVAALPVLRLVSAKLSQRREEARREQCLHELPEMIDVLALGLSAGLSFDRAFERYLDDFDTVLAKEFRTAQQAWQVGMTSRIRAFEEVAARLQEEAVVRFVAALRQAFTLGTPLTALLENLAFETRRYRKARIEERIAKTPVKLLIPLGACIVPAVLILLMGPVMTQVISGLNW